MEFINGWYLLLIVSDLFTITGSFIKIAIESKVSRRHGNTGGRAGGLATERVLV
jgi:hypothetical protein